LSITEHNPLYNIVCHIVFNVIELIVEYITHLFIKYEDQIGTNLMITETKM